MQFQNKKNWQAFESLVYWLSMNYYFYSNDLLIFNKIKTVIYLENSLSPLFLNFLFLKFIHKPYSRHIPVKSLS